MIAFMASRDKVDQKVRDPKSESRSVCTDKIIKNDRIVVWEYYSKLC